MHNDNLKSRLNFEKFSRNFLVYTHKWIMITLKSRLNFVKINKFSRNILKCSKDECC